MYTTLAKCFQFEENVSQIIVCCWVLDKQIRIGMDKDKIAELEMISKLPLHLSYMYL